MERSSADTFDFDKRMPLRNRSDHSKVLRKVVVKIDKEYKTPIADRMRRNANRQSRSKEAVSKRAEENARKKKIEQELLERVFNTSVPLNDEEKAFVCASYFLGLAQGRRQAGLKRKTEDSIGSKETDILIYDQVSLLNNDGPVSAVKENMDIALYPTFQANNIEATVDVASLSVQPAIQTRNYQDSTPHPRMECHSDMEPFDFLFNIELDISEYDTCVGNQTIDEIVR